MSEGSSPLRDKLGLNLALSHGAAAAQLCRPAGGGSAEWGGWGCAWQVGAHRMGARSGGARRLRLPVQLHGLY